ncbi:MAG: oligosaccharide flippase family protein [Elainellaceae cyanobacterium]
MAPINAAKIAKSSLWLTSSFGFEKVMKLVAQIFLVRLLVPEQFGIWGMVVVVTHLTALFKDATIAGVLVQRGLDDKKLVNAVYSIGINVSIAMFVLQTLIGYIAAQFFQEPIVFPLTLYAAFNFLIGAGAGSHAAVLQRRMKFRELSIASTCGSAVRLWGSVLLAVLGFGVWSFAIASIGSSCTKAGLKYWFSRYPFQYQLIPDRDAIKNVSGFIGSLVGINLAVYVNTNGDDILVGKLLGARELGFYTLAYQLAMVPMFALSKLNTVNYSVIAQKNTQEQRTYIRKMLALCAIFSAPVYGMAFVVAPWMIPLLYGAEWQPVVSLFQIILVFAYARGFMSILGTALNALNHPEINAGINWILIPISMPAFYIGIQMGGIQGISIAVAGVMGVGATIWFWVATCRVTRWNLWELVNPIVLPTLATVLVVAIATSIPVSTAAIKFAVQPLIVLVGYLAIISIASKGQIPRMVLDISKRTLSLKA